MAPPPRIRRTWNAAPVIGDLVLDRRLGVFTGRTGEEAVYGHPGPGHALGQAARKPEQGRLGRPVVPISPGANPPVVPALLTSTSTAGTLPDHAVEVRLVGQIGHNTGHVRL